MESCTSTVCTQTALDGCSSENDKACALVSSSCPVGTDIEDCGKQCALSALNDSYAQLGLASSSVASCPVIHPCNDNAVYDKFSPARYPNVKAFCDNRYHCPMGTATESCCSQDGHCGVPFQCPSGSDKVDCEDRLQGSTPSVNDCSAATDDRGSYYLYSQGVSTNSSTPRLCSGYDYSSFESYEGDINICAAFAYDAASHEITVAVDCSSQRGG